MKRLWIIPACSMLLLGTQVHAGKNVAPATSEVSPVENDHAWYIGAGWVYGTFKSVCSRGCRYEDDTQGLLLKAGYDFDAYFGVEARALRTFWGKGPNGGERFEHFGLYAKPMLPFADRFTLYGLLGYGYTKTINSGGNGNLPEIDDWGFAWGVGLEVDLSDRKGDFIPGADYDRKFDGYGEQNHGWALFVEYQRLWDGHHYRNDHLSSHPRGKADIDFFTVGVHYHF